MIDIGIRNPQEQILNDILKRDAGYVIPPFQREFSWKKDDWIDFLEDIIKIKDKNRGHFFGFMTFRKENDEKISIIEGQQRLSTVTILIAVVRDMFLEFEDAMWQKLDSTYIKSEDILASDTPPSYKLVLSDINKEYFRKHIQEPGTPKQKLEQAITASRTSISNKLIIDCYKYLHEEITKRVFQFNTDEKKRNIIELLEGCLKKFVIVSWEVADDKAAYNIFQTLNDRGMELTQSDLLKIYLFDRAEDLWPDAKERWEEIRELLATEDMTAFLRHYWLSSERVVKQQDLLSEVESKIKKKTEVFQFLEILKKEAEQYDALLNPTSEYWEGKDAGIIELLQNIHILSKRQPLPLLMAALVLQPSEFHKILEYTLCFVFRYLTIAEAENKTLEKLFSDIAIDIRNKKLSRASDVKDRMKREYIEDNQFIATFEKKEIKTNKVAKYILKSIEDFLSGDAEKVSSKISLEHIMPIKPNREWQPYLKSHGIDKEDYVYRLGNMTLLTSKVNKDAQSQFYTIKRDQFYAKMTQLKINEPLAKITEWTEEEIQKRQEYLAEQAIKIWKL